MSDQFFSWLAGGIGLVGFWLSGKKLWWSWYVNIVNQAAWIVFALITGYYAFLVTAAFYTFVFSRNAYLWTKEHRLKVHEERLDAKEPKVGDLFPPDWVHGDVWRMWTDHGMVNPVGQIVDKDTYPELYKKIGDAYNESDDISDHEFQFPNMSERLDRLAKGNKIKYQGTPADSRSYLDSFPIAEPKIQTAVCNGFQNNSHIIKHWACDIAIPHTAHPVTIPPLGRYR